VCGLLFWVWGYISTHDAFPVAWALQTTRFTRCLIRSECLNVKPCTAPAHTQTHTCRYTDTHEHTHTQTLRHAHTHSFSHTHHTCIYYIHTWNRALAATMMLVHSYGCNEEQCKVITVWAFTCVHAAHVFVLLTCIHPLLHLQLESSMFAPAPFACGAYATCCKAVFVTCDTCNSIVAFVACDRRCRA
jgi:hypothetical protein